MEIGRNTSIEDLRKRLAGATPEETEANVAAALLETTGQVFGRKLRAGRFYTIDQAVQVHQINEADNSGAHGTDIETYPPIDVDAEAEAAQNLKALQDTAKLPSTVLYRHHTNRRLAKEERAKRARSGHKTAGMVFAGALTLALLYGTYRHYFPVEQTVQSNEPTRNPSGGATPWLAPLLERQRAIK